MEKNKTPIGEKLQIKNLRKIANHIGLSLFCYTVISYAAVNVFAAVAVWFIKGFTNFNVNEVVNSSSFSWISVLVCQDLIGVLAFVSVARLKKPIYIPTKEKKRVTFKSGCIIFIISVATMQIGAYISAFLSQMVESIRGIALKNDLNSLVMQSNVFTVFVMAVVIGPIIEEFIYRKFIIDRLKVYGEKFALISSALLFALAHGNFYQVFYSFGVGLIFGYVYIKTNNIKINILYHMGVNFIGTIIPLLFMNSGTFSQESFGAGIIFYLLYLLLLFATTAAGVTLLFLNMRKIRFSKMPFDEIKTKDKVNAFVFNLGMILTFISVGISFAISV